MKRCLFVPFMLFLAGCTVSERETSSDDAVDAKEVMEVTVAPQKVDCHGVAPMKCLVVDGSLFYNTIQGFDFVEGYEYTLKIKRTQRFTESNAPADASLYEYELLEIQDNKKVDL